jgi:hypothetical protein
MRSSLTLVFALLVGCGGGSSSPTVDEHPVPAAARTRADAPELDAHATQIVAEVERELGDVRSTHYQHTTSVDEARGVFDFDCSGFVAYALDRSYPDGMQAIRAATQDRPLASDFERLMAASEAGFTRVGRAIDAEEGDIVAWLEPPEKASANTGHVMIVMGAPTASSTRGDEVLIPIADSTSTPHGAADARTASGTTGLGRGVIGLVVDDSGAPIAYRWVGGESAKAYATEIAIGRPR